MKNEYPVQLIILGLKERCFLKYRSQFGIWLSNETDTRQL